jgi:hypothetical protein
MIQQIWNAKYLLPVLLSHRAMLESTQRQQDVYREKVDHTGQVGGTYRDSHPLHVP